MYRDATGTQQFNSHISKKAYYFSELVSKICFEDSTVYVHFTPLIGKRHQVSTSFCAYMTLHNTAAAHPVLAVS